MYSDRIDEATRQAVNAGHQVLQFFKLPDERDHVALLIDLLGPIKANSRIIDIGCGVGQVARLMREEMPDLSFVLVNNNAYQLEHCKDFETRLTDMHDCGEGGFDYAIVNYTLGYSDLGRFMVEAKRILNPDGVLFIYDFEGDSPIVPALGYRTFSRIEIEGAAKDAGFSKVIARNINLNAEAVRDFLGDELVDELHRSLKPVVWWIS